MRRISLTDVQALVARGLGPPSMPMRGGFGEPHPQPKLSETDKARIAAAQAKRQRKGAKRLAEQAKQKSK